MMWDRMNTEQEQEQEEENNGNAERSMERPEWKQRILDDFTKWVDELEEIPIQETVSGNEPDFDTLLREFTALRQEVRLQSRAGSKVGNLIEGVAEELSEKLQRIEHIEATLNENIPRARKESKRKAVESFFDILESIRRTADSMAAESLPILLTVASRKKTMDHLAKPLRLLKGKMEDTMRQVGLEPIAVLGQHFEALNMRVMNTSHSGALNNTITEIIRQGYRLEGELVRAAEIVVEQSEKGEENE